MIMTFRKYVIFSLIGLVARFPSVLGTFSRPVNRPNTIDLSSRADVRSIVEQSSRNHHKLRPVTIPLDVFFIGTELQWYGNITVGNPPQTVSVVFDTGSTELEITSTLCSKECDNQVKFDPSESKTFVDGGRNFSLIFDTGVGVDPAIGDEYILLLRNGTDTVSIGDLSAPELGLFLITNQTEAFGKDPFSGILGMSTLTTGFLGSPTFLGSLAKQGLPFLFGMFLSPATVGYAEITIGGVDKKKFRGTPKHASVTSNDGKWTIYSSEISVNGKTTPEILNIGHDILFDSGTSNLVFPTNITEAIYSLISPDIKPNPKEPGSYGISCDRISSLPAVIDFTFISQSGQPFNLTIPSNELNVGPFADDPSTCQTLINALDDVIPIIGGSLYKYYYVIHDAGRLRMGFAPLSESY